MAKMAGHKLLKLFLFLPFEIDVKPRVDIGDGGGARKGAIQEDSVFFWRKFPEGDPIVPLAKYFVDNGVEGEDPYRLPGGAEDDGEALAITTKFFNDMDDGVFLGDKPGGASMLPEFGAILEAEEVAGIGDGEDSDLFAKVEGDEG